MKAVLLVALGGALGAVGRYLIGGMALRAFGPGYPWGTLIANVLGSFLMGVLVGWLGARLPQGEGGANQFRLLLGVGLLGGFTTFSAFSHEAVQIIEKKTYGLAAGYISASVVLSIGALVLGVITARRTFVL